MLISLLRLRTILQWLSISPLPPPLRYFRMIWDIHIYIYFSSPGISYSLCNKSHKTYKILHQRTFLEKEVDLCPILYTLTIFNREKQIFDHTSRWNIFVTLFLSYKALIEQWCSKNVHMERVRSTQVIVKQLVWCFILFSRRTSLEYPVWKERLSCWKEILASDFFFIFSLFSLWI